MPLFKSEWSLAVFVCFAFYFAPSKALGSIGSVAAFRNSDAWIFFLLVLDPKNQPSMFR
jgi:hypothetical protein